MLSLEQHVDRNALKTDAPYPPLKDECLNLLISIAYT